MVIDTQVKILEIGKQEFLEKGFKEASLRTIATKAGVTTGAIYGYYSDKEKIFEAVVDDVAEKFKNNFLKMQKEFADKEINLQIEEMKQKINYSQIMLNSIYDNFEIFKLLLCKSDGTKYENYLHSLIDIETTATMDFIERINVAGDKTIELSENMVHIISTAYFSSMIEVVNHDMKKEEAEKYFKTIYNFFRSGWSEIFKF